MSEMHTKGKRYAHRWGFEDTDFVLTENRELYITGSRYPISGKLLPNFMSFVDKVLGFKINTEDPLQENTEKHAPEPNINTAFFTAVKAFFDENMYSFDKTQRLTHSHGQTTADEYMKVCYENLDRVVDMVFFCENEQAAVKIISLAREYGVCLIPYGGGTNVSCALKVPQTETRMVVSLDMRRMRSIEWIDYENGLACVQAGITGIELESELEKKGYTFGHEPDSIELSTLGGWISTNASGMKKNRYGNIEHVIERIHYISPEGDLTIRCSSARQSIGSNAQLLLFGSEGNFGLITKALIRIRKLPELTEYASIVFSDFHRGTAFMHDLQRSGNLPASVRLVDNLQFQFSQALKPAPSRMGRIKSVIQKFVLTKIKRFDLGSMVAATIVYAGSKTEVQEQKKRVKKLMQRYGGLQGGASNGKGGYVLTYLIAYIRDFLAPYQVLGETYETTVPWDKIHTVCEAVAREAAKMHEEFNLPGNTYVSPRITQLYPSGVCIYFTHGFSTEGVEGSSGEIFSSIEKHMRTVIMDNGGSLSHHHGVGKLRASFADRVHSDNEIKLLHHVKQAIDPNNIFGVRNNIFSINQQ